MVRLARPGISARLVFIQTILTQIGQKKNGKMEFNLNPATFFLTLNLFLFYIAHIAYIAQKLIILQIYFSND